MYLGGIRQEIDRVDKQMKDLFLERMEYSSQVVQVKKQLGGSVYVPKREQEILCLHQQGVQKEQVLECREFFRQMMGLSRTYQYSKLVEGKACLLGLPDGEGEVALEFSCGKESENLALVFQAAALAGLSVAEMSASEYDGEAVNGKGESGEGKLYCRIRLAGNFAEDLARAVILQILEETKEARLSSDELQQGNS